MKKVHSKSSTLVNQHSSSTTSLTNGKLKQLQGQQDEANLKLLRELCHVPGNKYCFDCGQRGPNYVNITIGSFVCMTCSGLLRGLTPPHRVKSISMASFTAEELELLKSHGNEYCRKVWLATCSSKDSKLGADNDPERLNNIKAFMSAKYEQKRYYVDPSRLPKGELEQVQLETGRSLQQQQANNIQKSPSLSSSTHSSDQSPTLNNFRNNINNNAQTHNRMINSMTLPAIKPLSSLLGSSPSINNDLASLNRNHNGLTNTTKISNPAPINFTNNLSQLTNGNHSKSTPWEGTSTNPGNTNNEFITNFADFDDAFNNLPSNSASNDFNFSNGSSNIFPTQSVSIPQQKSNGIGASFHGIQPPLIPSGHSSSNMSSPSNQQDGFNNLILNTTSSNNNNTSSSDDKYAALKDLDSIFKQTSNGDKDNASTNGPSASSLPNSVSLPSNLSSNVTGSTNETGWFSTSPNPNPFSQVPAPVVENGWPTGGSANPTPCPNHHNPFFASNGWQSSVSNQFSNGTNSSVFPTMASSQTMTFGMNGTMPFPVQRTDKPFNPFYAPPKSNPNNPFL